MQLDKASGGRILLGSIHHMELAEEGFHATLTHEKNLRLAAQQAQATRHHPATGVSIDATRTEATFEDRPVTLYTVALRNTPQASSLTSSDTAMYLRLLQRIRVTQVSDLST
jgi:hypothetical protein